MKKLYFLINSNSKIKKEAVFEILTDYFPKNNLEIKQKFFNIKFPKTPKKQPCFFRGKKRAELLKIIKHKNKNDLVTVL